ncbi:MAG: hypothetical protein BGO12_19135 [Verrucomicrobia bacterium 61-8]|nr:MAG: hypothetical protein BGO12_19135 [Verrucomicrobia bacterium 61-8]
MHLISYQESLDQKIWLNASKQPKKAIHSEEGLIGSHLKVNPNLHYRSELPRMIQISITVTK